LKGLAENIRYRRVKPISNVQMLFAPFKFYPACFAEEGKLNLENQPLKIEDVFYGMAEGRSLHKGNKRLRKQADNPETNA